MKQTQAKSGFIMILVLMVTALTVVLASYLMNKTMVFAPIAQATIEGEKAEQLAYGGIQLAMSQLAYADTKAKGKEEGQAEEPSQKQATQKPGEPPAQPPAPGGDPKAKQFLETILPVLNQWQTVTFDKTKDGFAGTIKICIMSEEGKINLNELYDFNKHAFVGKPEEIKSVLKSIFDTIKKNNGGDIGLDTLEKFLKERTTKLQDVTELITIKGFENFKDFIFYEPAEGKAGAQEKRPIFLTDIFTIWSQSTTVDPWLFSTSLIRGLGLKQPEIGGKEQKEKVAGLLKTFKPNYTWPADWKNFTKLYEKDFNGLPKGIQALLGTSFSPRIFSVLSIGTVGKFSKRFFAILEREKAEGSPQLAGAGQRGQSPKQEKQLPATVTLRKVYWI